jgi:hypothetical protein
VVIRQRLANEVEAPIESAVTWLYIASARLIAPSGSGPIDAYESVPGQNQSSGIAEAIRVRLSEQAEIPKSFIFGRTWRGPRGYGFSGLTTGELGFGASNGRPRAPRYRRMANS